LAIAIYLISLWFTQIFFIDPYVPQRNKITILKFLQSVGDVFLLSWKEKLFFLFLLNLLGWYLLAVSLSEFLIARFNLSNSQVGLFNSYLSFCFTIGGIIGTVWLLHWWKAKNILFWSLIIGSLGLFLVFEVRRIVELWTYLAIPALTEAWIYPAYQTVLSDKTSEKNQGKLFGLIGATNGICQFVASLILGGISGKFSILVAALLFLSSGALMPALMRKKKTI